MLPVVLEVMLTVGFELVVIVIVIVFDVAEVTVGHCALDVIMQRTTEPVASVVEVNVLLLVPAFTPFTCHW